MNLEDIKEKAKEFWGNCVLSVEEEGKTILIRLQYSAMALSQIVEFQRVTSTNIMVEAEAIMERYTVCCDGLYYGQLSLRLR